MTHAKISSLLEHANKFLRFVPFILLIVAIVILRREFAAIEWKDIVLTFSQVKATSLIGTAICIVVSYSCAGASDWLGVRHTGSKIPLFQIIKTAALARSFSNTIGMGMLSGGVIRFRYYSEAGLDPLKIARVILIYSLGCTVGLIAMGGVVFILFPHDIDIPHFSSSRPLGLFMIGATVIYYACICMIGKPVRIRTITLVPFAPKLAFPHLPFAMVDWLAAAVGLYFILPVLPGVEIQSVITAFFLAVLVGHVSGVPSAIGVFEAAIVIFLGGNEVKETLIPWLILYRLVFYLIPFSMAFVYVALTLSGGIRSLWKKKPG